MASENNESQNSKTHDDIKNDEINAEKDSKINETVDNDKDDDKISEKYESEEEMGLLDRPVEVTGSRERKKVQRLELSFTTPSKDKHEIPEGTGQKLGECPRIEFQIQKNKLGDLKPLHKILFNRPGSGNEIKKNIRKFSGFSFTKDSNEFERKKGLTEKCTTQVLKHVCEILDLERGGTKEEIVIRILEFLLSPKDSGKKVAQSKKKGSAKAEKKKALDKKVKSTGKKGNKSKKESTTDEESESLADDESDANDSDDESKKKPPSKLRETLLKGRKPEINEKSKKEEKKPSKAQKRKRGDDSDEASSDDEPLVKKNKMPSDDDIKKVVKEILDSADLQEITMKKVIKQVADKYPDCDLSDKKEFIKSTVKSVIS